MKCIVIITLSLVACQIVNANISHLYSNQHSPPSQHSISDDTAIAPYQPAMQEPQHPQTSFLLSGIEITRSIPIASFSLNSIVPFQQSHSQSVASSYSYQAPQSGYQAPQSNYHTQPQSQSAYQSQQNDGSYNPASSPGQQIYAAAAPAPSPSYSPGAQQSNYNQQTYSTQQKYSTHAARQLEAELTHKDDNYSYTAPATAPAPIQHYESPAPAPAPAPVSALSPSYSTGAQQPLGSHNYAPAPQSHFAPAPGAPSYSAPPEQSYSAPTPQANLGHASAHIAQVSNEYRPPISQAKGYSTSALQSFSVPVQQNYAPASKVSSEYLTPASVLAPVLHTYSITQVNDSSASDRETENNQIGGNVSNHTVAQTSSGYQEANAPVTQSAPAQESLPERKSYIQQQSYEGSGFYNYGSRAPQEPLTAAVPAEESNTASVAEYSPPKQTYSAPALKSDLGPAPPVPVVQQYLPPTSVNQQSYSSTATAAAPLQPLSYVAPSSVNKEYSVPAQGQSNINSDLLEQAHSATSASRIEHEYLPPAPQKQSSPPSNAAANHQSYSVSEPASAPVSQKYFPPILVDKANSKSEQATVCQQSYPAPVSQEYLPPALAQKAYAKTEQDAVSQQSYSAPAPASTPASVPVNLAYLPPAPVSQKYLPPAPIQQTYTQQAKTDVGQQSYSTPAADPAPLNHEYLPPAAVSQEYLPPAPVQQTHAKTEKAAVVQQSLSAPASDPITQEYLPPVKQYHGETAQAPVSQQPYLAPSTVSQKYLPSALSKPNYTEPANTPVSLQSYSAPAKAPARIDQAYLPSATVSAPTQQSYNPPAPQIPAANQAYLPPTPVAQGFQIPVPAPAPVAIQQNSHSSSAALSQNIVQPFSSYQSGDSGQIQSFQYEDPASEQYSAAPAAVVTTDTRSHSLASTSATDVSNQESGTVYATNGGYLY